jgi:hypothetical protein
MSNNSYYNDAWRIINNKNQSLVSNYSMEFDYLNADTIQLNNAGNSLFNNATAFTISAWVNPSAATGTFQNILSNYGNNAARQNVLFRFSNTGALQFLINADYTFTLNTLNTPIQYNQWQHVAVTYDGVNMKIYYNGTLNIFMAATGVVATSTEQDQIGWRAPYGQYFNGLIDQTCIFDYALPATGTNSVATLYGGGTAVTNPMSLNPKPVAYYQLGDQSVDSGANYLVPNNSLNGSEGYSPYALSLDGTSNFFKLGTASDSTLGGSTSFTVTSWVKPINNSGFQYIFGSWGGGVTTRSYSLGILNSNKIRFQLFSTDGSTTILDSSTNEISYGVWQSITVTYDGTNLKMFKNGIEDASSVVINNKVVYNSLYADSIGRRSSVAYANYFYGDISNCAIWRNSVINPVTIYNNGLPANLNNLSTKPSYWWQLGSNSSFDANTNKWTCLNEGTERTDAAPVNAITGVANMTNDDITNGVGYSANGLGTSSIEIIGDSPYSTANGISNSMDVLDRTTDIPPTV